MKLLTVSQIARRTGLTVRALHHFEAKGLLAPTARSAAGYRLYGAAELRRLQHIVSLKGLGFSLAEIRAALDADAPTLAQALHRQVVRLRAAVSRQQQQLARIESVAARVAAGVAIDVDTWLNSIEDSIVMEKYFSSEQLEAIRRRGEEAGPERILAVEQEWPQLIAGMKAAMELGKDPASEEVQALARRWRALVKAFSGGDPGIEASMNRMYREEPAVMQQRTGIDPTLMAYARAAVGRLSE